MYADPSQENGRKPEARKPQGDFNPFTNSGLDARRAWATALMDLKTFPGAEAHLKGSRLLARDGDELVVGAASAYAAGWLDRRVALRAGQVLSALGGEPVSVRFVAANEWRG